MDVNGPALCPYCGMMPVPVTLLRVDGTTITAPSTPGPDHAVDCPRYGFPRQPREVGGPGLTAVPQLRRR
jgi:hypothetical protein